MREKYTKDEEVRFFTDRHNTPNSDTSLKGHVDFYSTLLHVLNHAIARAITILLTRHNIPCRTTVKIYLVVIPTSLPNNRLAPQMIEGLPRDPEPVKIEMPENSAWFLGALTGLRYSADRRLPRSANYPKMRQAYYVGAYKAQYGRFVGM